MPEAELREYLEHSLTKSGFTGAKGEILRECYLQHNRIDSCAYKLHMTRDEVRMWYLRMTVWSAELEIDRFKAERADA